MRETLKRLPGVRQIIRSRRWQQMRNAMVRSRAPREQSHYTHFLRLPGQFDALAGPVLRHVSGAPGRGKNGALRSEGDPLRIAIVGCSMGKEAYTVASTLLLRHPDLSFHVHATDIEPEVVRQAAAGEYTREEVFSHDLVTDDFVHHTFDIDGDRYRVRPEVASRVEFGVADVFAEDLPELVPPGDVVFAQNFLFHMKPRVALRAFESICRLLRPRSALFVDGMDLPVRSAATRKHDLAPLDYKIEEIHQENLRLGGWPWEYWGLEPFTSTRKDWKRRYATVFLRD